jgi:hypothetical protein
VSEYQYYEFMAIDRPLTEEEQAAVSRLSSRVEPHPRRAVFTYNYGDFPANPEKILAQYYDAMLYLANWGSRRLMFRFPEALVDLDQMRQYQVETIDYPSDAVAVSTAGEYVILDIQFDEEGGGEWIEGEGRLDALVGLREALLQQDYCLLYLAWLAGLATEDVDDDTLEPPVPPGLGNLTPALEAFVELFGVDADLIQAAVERSGERTPASGDGLRRAIAQLPAEERDAFLLRLAQGEPNLSTALKRRLGAFAPAYRDESSTRRTVGQLRAAAQAVQERRRRERAARAEAKRIAELEALAKRGDAAWREVDALIQQSQAQAYDQAVRLLGKLKELAEYQKQEAVFQERLGRVCELCSRRSALMKRLRQAGLAANEPE